MFLKSLEINGFKSFADKTHIDFSDGITSLLGPNGCGKSNIVDSIKWVLGEQSTKTLRAARMDDVIFSGTETRKPLQMAEVTLTIDNEAHNLPTDLPEIVIRRRIYRSGESEYYMNGQRCLLKNIRELFMDTGVGKTAYSILEQGKIDQILSNKPEDRRYIFEEAAGISRYKAKCTEAQNRIERSEENIAQLMTVINEVKRVYDRTKVQASKAMKWEELREKAFYLDVDIKLTRLDTFLKLKDMRTQKRDAAKTRSVELNAKLSFFDGDISSSSDEVKECQERSKNLEIAIGKAEATLSNIAETIAAYDESYIQYLEKLKSTEERCGQIQNEIDRTKGELENVQVNLENYEEKLEEKESQLRYTERTLQETRNEIFTLNETIRKAEENNSSLDQELQELSEALKSVIEDLIMEVDAKTGTEFSAERRDGAENAFRLALENLLKNLQSKSSFVENLPEGIGYSRDIALKDFTKLRSDITSLTDLFDAYKDSIPPVIDTILSPEGLVSRKRDIEEKEENARDIILNNRRIIEGARVQRASRENDVQTLQTTISSAKELIGSLRVNVENQKETIKRLNATIVQREMDLDDERSASEVARRRVHEMNDRIKAKEEERTSKENEIKNLKEELAVVNEELTEKFKSLDSKRREKETILAEINKCDQESTSESMYIESIDRSINELFTNFFDTYARNLAEFEDRLTEDMPEETTMKAEFDQVNQEIKALGNINHLAKDEFDQAEDQYKFYSKQLEDYQKAKNDMESVLGEILDKSKEMFLASYKTISDNFQAMFKRLFGGGRAELSLSEPDDVLNSGIEILAQPPGKSMSTLSLLSGGERSMTAVALLFATYQVKPSPFCILDEIDAALDDRNIGFFLDVLQDFARDSQFIIITHNTHTVTGGNAMLGVSQMEAGVSTAVAYRVASIEGQPRILNDEGTEVEFDEEGRQKKANLD
ncbi:MAG: AAA family ATPase [Spirochaetales bacterium]|nr:AAA family ATPase [Candidatus Physcosoma equi]